METSKKSKLFIMRKKINKTLEFYPIGSIMTKILSVPKASIFGRFAFWTIKKN